MSSLIAAVLGGILGATAFCGLKKLGQYKSANRAKHSAYGGCPNNPFIKSLLQDVFGKPTVSVRLLGNRNKLICFVRTEIFNDVVVFRDFYVFSDIVGVQHLFTITEAGANFNEKQKGRK